MATKLLMVLYTLGPRELTVGYWMSPLLWQDVPTTPHVMGLYRDCSQVPFLLKLQYCSHKRKWVGKKVNGDEKSIGWFWTPERNVASCSRSPFGVPKGKGKEQENQGQSKAGGRVHRWMDTPSSFGYSGSGCPSQSSQFIPEGLMRWVRNLSWKHRFPLFRISFCLSSHKLESSGLSSLFHN